MPTVLVCDHVFGGMGIEHEVLDPLGVDIVLAPATDEATLVELARDADAILVTYAQVTSPVIEAAARHGCRIVARYGIGYDNVDVEAAAAAGIVVTNVPDYCLDEVADHAMALLLALARGVMEAATVVRRGGWALPPQPVRRLQGQRLALLGVGRIGRRLVQRAQAFGFEVVAHDPYVDPAELPGVELLGSVDELVALADVISLHAPLTPESHHIIGERTFGAMRRAPIIVNTARGGLIDLDAATRALDDGRLTGLALDVTEPEPLPADHPLRRHPRAVITPHTAFSSVEAQADLQRRAAEEVARALRGEPPRCPVTPVAARSA